jgi:hypothetical protein
MIVLDVTIVGVALPSIRSATPTSPKSSPPKPAATLVPTLT